MASYTWVERQRKSMVPTPNRDDHSVICSVGGVVALCMVRHGQCNHVPMYPARVSHDITLQRGSAPRVLSLSESRPPSPEEGFFFWVPMPVSASTGTCSNKLLLEGRGSARQGASWCAVGHRLPSTHPSLLEIANKQACPMPHAQAQAGTRKSTLSLTQTAGLEVHSTQRNPAALLPDAALVSHRMTA